MPWPALAPAQDQSPLPDPVWDMTHSCEQMQQASFASPDDRYAQGASQHSHASHEGIALAEFDRLVLLLRTRQGRVVDSQVVIIM